MITCDRDICELSAEELQFIPKIILLQNAAKHIDYLWDKLPEYLKKDSEIKGYRRCRKHYNQPWQRTHIDGPPPLTKDCDTCKLIKACYECKSQYQQ